MFILGVIVGILWSILAVLTGKKFSAQINSEKTPSLKEERGYVVHLQDNLEKLIQK